MTARYAYADPPYPGMAKLYDAEAAADGRRSAEVNHPLLIAHLCDEYPDGWALSTSATALHYVLPLCPPDVRVGSWVKPFASFKPNVKVAYTWEPVIFLGGRSDRDRYEPTVRDHLIAPAVPANITMRRGFPGAKPTAFCRWVLDVLGALPGDTVDDLFPGSGAFTATVDGYLHGNPPHEPGSLFAPDAAATPA